ncbi:hypothetical protein AVEN_177237-1 [Araneus ventricosus]|uniref:Uncharacterized protein n=1 Tax=Araneus ventricosus TaxID=182803 RepID=A0A4Y2VSS9_ARAVE|nr:hypothetical protein AVEN_177237-1 [Araneus ventricosus]
MLFTIVAKGLSVVYGDTGNNSSCTNYQCKQTTIRSAQLTSFLARTAEETLKSFPMDQHSYRSASNSLLARTADRTQEKFALQGDPSRTTPTSDLVAVLKYSLR